MKTFRVADVCTKYITPKDAELLARDAKMYRELIEENKHHHHPTCPCYLVHEYPEGFWVHVPYDELEAFIEEERHAAIAGYSSQFLEIMQHMCNNKVGWLRLDADGQELDGFEEQEW